MNLNLNLKHLLGTALLAAAALGGGTVAQAADVGVSVSISQPGVYGRVDIGRFPQPAVIVERPVIVHRAVRVREPVYMWVPPGHRKNWSRHCGKYGACSSPVYFVRDSWYDDRVYRHPGFRDEWRHNEWRHNDVRRDEWRRGDRGDRGRYHDQRRGGRHDRDD